MGPEVLAGPAADAAVNTVISLLKKHSKYVFCFNTYIQILEEKLHDLDTKEKDVLRQLREGETDDKKPDDEVKEWLNKVKAVRAKRKEILAKIDKHKASSCFCGTVPAGSHENANESMLLPEEKADQSKRSPTGEGSGDGIPKKYNSDKSSTATGGSVLNPWTRWRTSRKVVEVTDAIVGLKDKTFERYTHSPDPQGVVNGSCEDDVDPKYFFPASRQIILQDINKALINPNISIVGVWGPSGVGKSTLLDLVVRHVKGKKFGYKFDEVAKATVSRTPDIERIQEELADWLGLKAIKEVSSIDSKAEKLRKRLNDDSKRYLIILDDLARKIDLGKIGIPFKNGGNVKLLLTSRYEEVLQREMVSDPNFKLGPFGEEEAFDLFKRTLDDKVVEDEETLKLIKPLLINECAGLPLSVNGLAIRLRSSPLSEWKNVLKRLQHSNILGVKNFIDEMLESSYDVIDSKEVKSLFLLCGQIGTQIISVDKLVTYGMSLGIFEGIDTVQEARDRVDTLLAKLKSCCLLGDEKPGFIKIHDLVSDVALGIASKTQHSVILRSGDQLVKAYITEDLQRCKSISILNVQVDIEELPKGLSCPELNMFSLVSTEDYSTKFKLSDAFFQDMKKLKVLELSNVILVPLPHSIQLLHQLQTLCLDSCDVEDWTFLGKLKLLQVLIIRKSEMVQLPKVIEELTDLRVLDLRTCNGLEIIEQGILGSLTKLEELLLPESFERWDEGGVKQPSNASLNELNSMLCLSALQIKVPDFAALPNDLPLVNLMRFSIYARDISDTSYRQIESSVVHFNEARTLTLKLNLSNSRVIFEVFVQIASQKAWELHLYGWVGIERSVASLFRKCCSELKCLDVQDCHSIEYVIDLDQKTQFPSLESLYLKHLANLKKLFLGGLLAVPFRNLKAITIKQCESLRHLFPFALMKNLHVLERFKVAHCEMIQDIVTVTAEEDDAIQADIADSKCELLEFKALRELSLKDLPAFLRFCTKTNQYGDMIEIEGDSSFQQAFLDGRKVSFPQLESLSLSELPELRKVAYYLQPPNLQNLKSLALSYCGSLLSAIDSKLLLMLADLEVLDIGFCESMETVFEIEDLSNDEIIKRGLESLKPDVLKLSNLYKLKKIWSSTPHNISLVVNLRKLEIWQCDRLEYVFSSSMAKSLKNLSHLSIKKCSMIKGVFMEETSVDKNHSFSLPCLKELVIASGPNMSSFVSLESESGDESIKESFFSSKAVLPSLETLVLEGLGGFKSIWDSSYSDEQSFLKLTSVKVEGCHSLTVIFPSIMVKRLQELKEVEARNCCSLKAIFESGDESSMVSNLNKMKLDHLSSLTHIVMAKSIPNKTVLGFPSLTDIHIQYCGNLINLFDTATAMTLSELKNLSISICSSMKEVFSESGGDEYVGRKMMAFDNLFSLELHNLGRLTHFRSGHSELYFPNLRKFSISACRNFKAFIPMLASAAEQKDNTGSSSMGSKAENEDGVFSPLFNDKVILPNLQDLLIHGLELIKELWHDKLPSGSFCKLQCLKVLVCKRISVVIPSFMLHNLHNLEELRVCGCNAVEFIFQLDGQTLRERKLARSTFCKLKSLEVSYCGSLRNLFTVSTAEILKKLEVLRIEYCKNMEEVVARGNLGHTDTGGTYKTPAFPQLSDLYIEGMRKLRSFCTEKHTTKWPSLKRIQISGCYDIKAFMADPEEQVIPFFWVEKESWDSNNKSGAFPKLESIQIDSCTNLLTVFPPTTIGDFRNLKSLTVRRCDSLEKVFQVEDHKEEEVSWGNNKEGAAADSNKDNIGFEKLREIHIEYCHSLEHVFPTSVAICLLQLSKLGISFCERMAEIVECEEENAAHRPIFFFPKLTSLTLYLMPQLRSFYGGYHSTKWPLLQNLNVSNCPEVKMLSSEQEGCRNINNNDEEKAANNNIDETPSFKATEIRTDMLQIPDEIIGNPTTLTIDDIRDEAAVQAFPWRLLLERPHNLRRLTIEECDFEEIFPGNNRIDERGHGQESDAIVPSPCKSETTGVLFFENIRQLTLRELPELRHVWEEGSSSAIVADVLDIVETLEVQFCPLLRGILCASSSSTSASFNNLKVLKIIGCEGLRHVLTSSTARCLVHLTVLEVEDCKELEEIVTQDYDDFKGDKNRRAKHKDNADITFHRLTQLKLRRLSGFRCFSSTSCNFNFPCLANFEDYDIKMEFFCKGTVRVPLLSEKKRRELGIQVPMERGV